MHAWGWHSSSRHKAHGHLLLWPDMLLLLLLLVKRLLLAGH